MDNKETIQKLQQDLQSGIGIMAGSLKGLTDILMERVKNADPETRKKIHDQIKDIGLNDKVSELNETLKKFKQDFGGDKK